jgi:Carotenoid biosynthesis protein
MRLPGLVARPRFRWRLWKKAPRRTNLACAPSRGLRHGHDPVAATVQKQWIWHDGGSYFGVPFVNYLGWLLCVYTIFQLFAIYISRQNVASEQEEPSGTTDRAYWYQAAAAYATTGLTSALPALTGGNAVITDATGQQWQAMQIYQSMALIAIFTMGFVALLSVLLIDKHQRSL